MIVLPDEHRIFKATEDCIKRSYPRGLRPDEERGEWCIADQSGEMPEHTDDGLLWLDFDTRILLGKAYGRTIHLPVMTPDGKRFTTVTDPASLVILSDKFRWTMNVDGVMYRTVRW
jgi:hypothetical protein